MVVFVTGGSGFVGQHLIRAYAGKPAGKSTARHAAGSQAAGPEASTRVRALARSPHAAQAVHAAGAEPMTGDITDGAALRAAMAGCDLVVHAAGNTEQWAPREAFHRVNVLGTATVLAAAKAAGVPRLVHVSTEAVLADGRPLRHVDETYPRPGRLIGDYAQTKSLAEELVLAENGTELTTVVVRPRLVWGPGDATVLPAVTRAARAGRFAWIDGGHYRTSTCHVTNTCAGIVAAGRHGRGGEVYFLTDGEDSGEPVEFREFLTALAATAGVSLGDRSIPRSLAWAAATALEPLWRLLPLPDAPPITRTFLALSAQEMTVDDSKARTELGYRPPVTRAAGLAALASR
jgi:nucleoside-diphosphate-sugar epimerase